MRTCPTGKVVYATRSKAIRALDRVRADPRWAIALADRLEQSAYRCQTCGGFHLSHYTAERRVAA